MVEFGKCRSQHTGPKARNTLPLEMQDLVVDSILPGASRKLFCVNMNSLHGKFFSLLVA